MKKLFGYFLLIFLLIAAKPPETATVKWYTIEQALALNEHAPRKIMVDVFTDWCGWCKVMDQQTFHDPVIAKILNEKYYPVKFNAETRDTIVFQGRTFVNDGQGTRSAHQLAVAMLNGKLSYPNIVFIDENNQLITAIPGFRKPEEMEQILEYIGQSLYAKNVNFQEYLTTFKHTTTDELKITR